MLLDLEEVLLVFRPCTLGLLRSPFLLESWLVLDCPPFLLELLDPSLGAPFRTTFFPSRSDRRLGASLPFSATMVSTFCLPFLFRRTDANTPTLMIAPFRVKNIFEIININP